MTVGRLARSTATGTVNYISDEVGNSVSIKILTAKYGIFGRVSESTWTILNPSACDRTDRVYP